MHRRRKAARNESGVMAALNGEIFSKSSKNISNDHLRRAPLLRSRNKRRIVMAAASPKIS